MAKIKLPNGRDLAYATLREVDRRGGSAQSKELRNAVAEITGLTEGELEQLSLKSVKMQMGWARTGLKSSGHLDNSQRGVWSLTVEGRSLLRLEPSVAEETARHAYERGWEQRKREKELREAAEAGPDTKEDWKDGLLEAVNNMDAMAFARLSVRMLREAGFRDFEDAGRISEDRFVGLSFYKHHLISSRVYIWCHRRADSIPAREIRAFAEAMAGRANRGLFVTTGAFTRDAQRAAREGSRLIDLINGDEMCDLLKEHGLGIKAETREHITVSQEFFEAV